MADKLQYFLPVQHTFRKVVILSVLSLILTAPFFLYPLFERPSLSQAHYLTVAGIALMLLFALATVCYPPEGRRGIPLPLIGAWIFLSALFLSALISGVFLFSLKEMLFQIA
jgi:hypothetical protein